MCEKKNGLKNRYRNEEARNYMYEMYSTMKKLKEQGEWANDFDKAVRCSKCGDWLPPYTRGRVHWCSCKSLGIDGTSHYTRVLYKKNRPDQAEIREVEEILKMTDW